jgi:hypothetical protein
MPLDALCTQCDFGMKQIEYINIILLNSNENSVNCSIVSKVLKNFQQWQGVNKK